MSKLRRVDAHQHFWLMSRGDYGWLDDAPETLRQDFLPEHLSVEIDRAKVDATVVVQAAPSVAETEFLLGLADDHDAVEGVVGWVDLAAPSSAAELERLSASALFKGVRPMLQDLDNPRWLIDEGLPEAFEAIDRLGLTFDALVLPHQLPTLVEFVARYPNIPIVIDHAAKPRINDAPAAEWLDALEDLSQSPNVFCKYSGLVTEVDGEVSRELLQPYVDALIERFSPARMMWGSDWPVVKLRMEYNDWLDLSKALLHGLSDDDLAAIYCSTATRFYILGDGRKTRQT